VTLQKAKDLLASSNPSKEDLQKAINALNWQIDYVEKSVNAGLRESASTQQPIEEMRNAINQLEERLKSTNHPDSNAGDSG